MKPIIRLFSTVFLFVLALGLARADDVKLMPFVLASTSNGDMATTVAQVKQKLTSNGFEIAGTYSPYPTATVIVVTNDTLKQAAAKTDFGAFGAAERVTVTKGDNGLQVAYTNPVYMAAAYQMKADLSPVAASLRAALGYQNAYGPKEGLTADDLEDYHYKWLMPYFTDRLKLASYGNYQDAVQHVEKALAKKEGGVSKVYRIDIPGKMSTVFGVHMTEACSGDKYIMSRIDFKPVKSTGHLPYEMVVKGSAVYALPAEFRIAINFPDLSMMGSNSFASIMCAPNAIQKALTEAAGGSPSNNF
ncbi:MAG TPA: hypothetical protein VKA19_15685 [Alphaproteobacteria bacterium]|nr:hypothetical protein [Alphaproteobacteria bacterium]